MEMYRVFCCDETEKCDQVAPNFIYNRFDLWNRDNANQIEGKTELWCCESQSEKFYFEAYHAPKEIRLGMWLTALPYDAMPVVMDTLFKHNRSARVISFRNASIKYGDAIIHNHFRIQLPDTAEELSMRLSSKGRYNIKREKRILTETFGGYEIKHYDALSSEAEASWNAYFRNKSKTHDCNYNLTPVQYCARYHVTDVYALDVAERGILAVILSCEQCPVVYLENLGYDVEMSKFSPGQILYDEYLKALILKNKREIFLLGGDYEYKRRYGSIEETVYDCTVYRNQYTKNVIKIKKEVAALLKHISRCLNANR